MQSAIMSVIEMPKYSSHSTCSLMIQVLAKQINVNTFPEMVLCNYTSGWNQTKTKHRKKLLQNTAKLPPFLWLFKGFEGLLRVRGWERGVILAGLWSGRTSKVNEQE